MSYSISALLAVQYVKKQNMTPIEAWRKAVIIEFPDSESSQNKVCPRNAFLGLCEEGYVRGITAGAYTESKLNKNYGIAAIEILSSHKSVAFTAQELWKRVLAHLGNDANKKHNSQMNVVLALWNEENIIR